MGFDPKSFLDKGQKHPRKCRTCKHPGVSKAILDTLAYAEKSGKPLTNVAALHRALRVAFPDWDSKLESLRRHMNICLEWRASE